MWYALNMNNELAYEPADEEQVLKVRDSLPDSDKLNRLADFYKIMGDPTRLKILMALEQHEFCASDIANVVGMSRSAVSHQLKALRSAKLVKSRKEGKTVFYSLDDSHIHSVLHVAFEHILEDHPDD